MAEFSDLLGQVIVKITQSDYTIDILTFNGNKYRMHHRQDCCESVYIKDITGDLQDLLDHPILLAEEISQEAKEADEGIEYLESGTWTFYKLATVKANVTITWLGESNGYYSESVDFDDTSEWDTDD